MAERALPAATAPRTVTVRVRSLVGLAAIAALATTGWCLWWVTSLAPLGAARSGLKAEGLIPSEGLHQGPPIYLVSGGRPRMLVRLALHNSASIPVRITGVDPIGAPGAPFVGRLAAGDTTTLLKPPSAFRPITIAADGTGYVAIVFRVNPPIPCGRLVQIPVVVLHFATLGEFRGTQAIPLASKSPSVTGRC